MATGERILDRCLFNPTAGGTSDFTVSSAVTGYMTPATAGAISGLKYSYYAESSDKSQWEVGIGTYNSSGPVLARTTILYNSSGGTSAINFSTTPTVGLTSLARDITGGSTSGLWGPPSASSFGTTINGQSVSPAPAATDTEYGMVLDSGPSTSSDNEYAVLKSIINATTFTITARIKLTLGSNSFRSGGLVLSDNTKFFNWGMQQNAGALSMTAAKMTNATTFSVNARQIASGFVPEFFQFRGDGTTLYCEFSNDGRNFSTFFSEAIGTFLGTITRCGFGGDNRAATTPPASGDHQFITCTYYSET